MEREGYVVYDAPTQFNTKTITKQNWESVGVEDMDTVHWGPENNWKVPAKRFSEDAWPYVEAESSLRHEAPEKGPSDDRVEVSEPAARETAATGRRGRSR